MMSFFRPRVVAVAAILATLATLGYYDSIPPARGLFFFEATIATADAGTAQLYYDTGQGIREADSVQLAVPGNGTATLCRFPLPTGRYTALRFDPINRATTVDFSGARVVDRKGNVIRQFGPAQFTPDHQVTGLAPQGGGLRFVAEGDDPYLGVDIGGSFTLRQDWAALRHGLQAVGVFVLLFLAVLAISALPWRPDWLRVRELSLTVDPWLAGGIVLLIAVKLWLVSAQTLYGMGGAGHDDQLFVNQAHELLNGHWLGDYSQFTLMKGPMYSFLLAGSFLLGVPFFTTLQVIYAGACVLLLVALRPLVPHRGLRFAIFAVLLFNPVTYESVVHARMLRQNLIPGLALLTVAGFIGLYARRAEAPRRLVPWALTTGIALAAFWLTREESVWILPCVGLLWAAAVVAVWRSGVSNRLPRLAVLTMPALLCVAGVCTVAWINLRHYGVFTTCEFKQREFMDGFGSLMRVEPREWRPYLPVTRESRERIYAVSPAFAELRPFLEGALGESWAASSEGLTHLPPRDREIAVGWFMWAVRDAVAMAGHCTTGTEAMAYYARLAREVNEACDRGQLQPSGARRSGFVPPLRPEYLRSFFKAWPDVGGFFASLDKMYTGQQNSVGNPEMLPMFADLTRERLGPLAGGPPIPPLQHWLDDVRLGWLGRVSHFYHRVALWAGAASGLALLAGIILAVLRRRVPFFAVLSVGLLGSIGALVSAITLIQVTSFPAVNTGYFSGAYGLWLCFMFTGWLALHEVLQGSPHPTGRSPHPTGR